VEDELIRIADGIRPDGTPDPEDTQRSTLKINTRKWLLAKLAPQRYGDKLHLAGHDGGTVKTETETRVAPDALRTAAGLERDAAPDADAEARLERLDEALAEQLGIAFEVQARVDREHGQRAGQVVGLSHGRRNGVLGGDYPARGELRAL
jgi:hypothetical protein